LLVQASADRVAPVDPNRGSIEIYPTL